MELAALVGKMMAKEPERRFQEPTEVAKALTPFFKPGANPGSGPSPEISRVGQAATDSPDCRRRFRTNATADPRPRPNPRATFRRSRTRRGWRGRA